MVLEAWQKRSRRHAHFVQVPEEVLAGAASAALEAATAGQKGKAKRLSKLASGSDQEGKATGPGDSDAAREASGKVEAAAAPAVDLGGSSDEEDAVPLAKRRRKLLAQAAPRAAQPQPAAAGAAGAARAASSGGAGMPQLESDVIDLLDSSSDDGSGSSEEEESRRSREGGGGSSSRRGAGGELAPGAQPGVARRPVVSPPRSTSPEVTIESITQAPPRPAAAAAAAPLQQAPAVVQHPGRAPPAEQGPQAGAPAIQVDADGQAIPVKKPRRKSGEGAGGAGYC